MFSVVTAAPLKGYRTYILTGLAAVTIVAQLLIGDHTPQQALGLLWDLLITGGVATVRAAVR